MGHIQKRGDRYVARWRVDGRARSKSFGRKIDARRFLDVTEGDIARGVYIDPRAGRVTFGEFAAAWVEGQPWRPASRQKYEQDLRLHILPTLGPRPLGGLRTSELQTWVASLSASGLAPRTVGGAYRLTGAILRAAATDRIIPSSPAKGVRLPRPSARAPIVPLTVDQVEALASAMPARWAALVLVAAGLGLRRGEVLALTVDRVDFLRRTVTIDRQWSPAGFAATKTTASTATIVLPDTVGVVIARHIERFGVSGLLFTTAAGDPVSPSKLGKAFAQAKASVGVTARFHDLRHFTASALIADGRSPKAVQTFLRHARVSETLDTYAHLWPSDDDLIRSAVDGLFRRAM